MKKKPYRQHYAFSDASTTVFVADTDAGYATLCLLKRKTTRLRALSMTLFLAELQCWQVTTHLLVLSSPNWQRVLDSADKRPQAPY